MMITIQSVSSLHSTCPNHHFGYYEYQQFCQLCTFFHSFKVDTHYMAEQCTHDVTTV